MIFILFGLISDILILKNEIQIGLKLKIKNYLLKYMKNFKFPLEINETNIKKNRRHS